MNLKTGPTILPYQALRRARQRIQAFQRKHHSLLKKGSIVQKCLAISLIIPESHQAPKDGIKDFDSNGIARNDWKSPLVDAIGEWTFNIQAYRLP